MTLTDQWAKSSFSGSSNCVVVRESDGTVQLRNSRRPWEPPFEFTAEEWRVMLAAFRTAT